MICVRVFFRPGLSCCHVFRHASTRFYVCCIQGVGVQVRAAVRKALGEVQRTNEEANWHTASSARAFPGLSLTWVARAGARGGAQGAGRVPAHARGGGAGGCAARAAARPVGCAAGGRLAGYLLCVSRFRVS